MVSQLVALVSMAAIGMVAATDYPQPPPTFEASSYTSWTDKYENSKRGFISVPYDDGDINMVRLDLVGEDSYTRGFAHGYLLSKEIIEFMGPKLDQFYAQAILSIDVSQYPEPLQKILKAVEVKGAIASPKIAAEALQFVWDKEVNFTPDYVKKEIDGIAAGMCASKKYLIKDCNVDALTTKLRQVNMLPELIRMACTAYGAWGDASAPGSGLIQMRALDFGGGPFANYTVIQTHRGIDNPFVSVSFPGMVGVITGISESGVGVSEKVWMTYDKRSIQPGSYNGESDVFVLRDILQSAKTRQEAEDHLMKVNRTWAIWIGIGDYSSQIFDMVGYKQDSVSVWTDVTTPDQTGQPYMKSLAYVDKHPQPSGDGPNGTLPTALQDHYGNITCETSKVVTQYHQTGDVHIASYDYTEKTMHLAIGRVNSKGQYGPEGGDTTAWKAYNRPYLKFSLSDLWAGQ